MIPKEWEIDHYSLGYQRTTGHTLPPTVFEIRLVGMGSDDDFDLSESDFVWGCLDRRL